MTRAALRRRAKTSDLLSVRQKECVRLIARGKSNLQIGKALGISKETAHKHVQAAMARFAVKTRTQLVVHALHSGCIAFAEIIDEDAPTQRG